MEDESLFESDGIFHALSLIGVTVPAIPDNSDFHTETERIESVLKRLDNSAINIRDYEIQELKRQLNAEKENRKYFEQLAEKYWTLITLLQQTSKTIISNRVFFGPFEDNSKAWQFVTTLNQFNGNELSKDSIVEIVAADQPVNEVAEANPEVYSENLFTIIFKPPSEIIPNGVISDSTVNPLKASNGFTDEDKTKTVHVLHGCDKSKTIPGVKFVCSCGYFCEKEILLKTHIQYPEKVLGECPVCQMICFSTSGLKHHIRNVHSILDLSSRGCTCSHCYMRFATWQDAVEHNIELHNSIMASTENATTSSETEKTSKRNAVAVGTCSLSLNEFSNRKNKNCRQKHGQVVNQPNYCICGYKANTKGAWKAHLHYYANKWKFECQICGHKFVNKTDKQYHMAAAHKVKQITTKDIICSICNEKSKSWSIFQTHLKTQHQIQKRRREYQLRNQKLPKISLVLPQETISESTNREDETNFTPRPSLDHVPLLPQIAEIATSTASLLPGFIPSTSEFNKSEDSNDDVICLD